MRKTTTKKAAKTTIRTTLTNDQIRDALRNLGKTFTMTIGAGGQIATPKTTR